MYVWFAHNLLIRNEILDRTPHFRHEIIFFLFSVFISRDAERVILHKYGVENGNNTEIVNFYKLKYYFFTNINCFFFI